MTRYNYKTYRAVVVSFLQKWVGLVWHLPGRLWNMLRFRFEKPMAPEDFKARIAASNARIREFERKRIAALQAKADAASEAPKKDG